MKPFRVTIAATLGVIVVLAVGFMGMREGTAVWAASAFCLTLAFLLAATLRAALGSRSGRAGAFGFALFGWLYLATTFAPWGKLEAPTMPQSWLADQALERVHPGSRNANVAANASNTWQASSSTGVVQFTGSGTLLAGTAPNPNWSGDYNSFRQSAHSIAALAFGFLGLFCGRWTAKRNQADASENST
jgi:hypothetical protein